MPDLYLQSLMEGTSHNKKKDRFEIENEKQIEEYLKKISLHEEDPSKNLLMTPSMKRIRMKEQLQEEAKYSKLSSFVEAAFMILTLEGKKYLNNEHYESMIAAFANAYTILNKIDLGPSSTENFQTILNFDDETITSIFNIAVEKYKESQYADSLSLFILLLILIPQNSDYWYRAGIAAHECKNYELALQLYAGVSSLDPSLIAPWIFSVECHLIQNSQEEAKNAYAEAVKISETSQIDDSWKEALSKLKMLLN